ncbi:MAG: WYL domain-containing protein [Thermodesulfobacteriota bacterium]
MRRNKSQLQRLVFIDQRIRAGMQSGRLANCRSMAAEYEVSYKSIQRDIDYLKHQQNAPIAYDYARQGFYYEEENYTLPAITLSESDIFAMFLAEQALQQYRNTPIFPTLRKVFNKLAASLPDDLSLDPGLLDHHFSFKETGHTLVDTGLWEMASTAIRNRRVLAISYRKPGCAATEQRHIDPRRMIHYQGEWYLHGFCRKRRAVRTFSLSRIKAAHLSEEVFPPPPADEPTPASGFGIFHGSRKMTVTIRFGAADAPFVRERIWHEEQRIEEQDGGGLLLSFPASHLQEVKRWVLSWGKGAEAVEPAELVELLRLELEETVKKYRKGREAGG